MERVKETVTDHVCTGDFDTRALSSGEAGRGGTEDGGEMGREEGGVERGGRGQSFLLLLFLF